MHVYFPCVFGKYDSCFFTRLPLAEAVLIPSLYYPHRQILVICPSVCRAKGLASLFFTQFFAVSLPHSGQIGLLCTGCMSLKCHHLVSLQQFPPRCRNPRLFVSNTDCLLPPSPRDCENRMETAFCFDGLTLPGFLAVLSDGFHFPNAARSLETLRAPFAVNVMLQ